VRPSKEFGRGRSVDRHGGSGIRASVATGPCLAADSSVPKCDLHMIGRHGFNAASGRIRGEHGVIDGDRQILFAYDVFDSAKTILSAVSNGSGIERRHIKLDAWSGQIDSHPVN